MGIAPFRAAIRPLARARTHVALLLVALLVAISVPSAVGGPPDAGTSRMAIVLRSIDGDTIRVDLAGRRETVRYIGVDAPELHHPRKGEEPGGRAAAAVNRALVEGKPVRLELDVRPRDRHGRLLAYVWLRGDDGHEVMANAEIVRRGYAHVATVPPNVRHAALFRSLEREARHEERGLWARFHLDHGGEGTTPPRRGTSRA